MTPSAVTAALARALAAQTPAPSPSPDQQLTIYTVTPGIGGFLAFFVLALASWVLFRSMSRHMRTVDRNAAARGEAPVRRGIGFAPAEAAADADPLPDGAPVEGGTGSGGTRSDGTGSGGTGSGGTGSGGTRSGGAGSGDASLAGAAEGEGTSPTGPGQHGTDPTTYPAAPRPPAP